MNINQAIEEWLDLCPCKDLNIKDKKFIFEKFNRSKTITLLYNEVKNDIYS